MESSAANEAEASTSEKSVQLLVGPSENRRFGPSDLVKAKGSRVRDKKQVSATHKGPLSATLSGVRRKKRFTRAEYKNYRRELHRKQDEVLKSLFEYRWTPLETVCEETDDESSHDFVDHVDEDDDAESADAPAASNRGINITIETESNDQVNEIQQKFEPVSNADSCYRLLLMKSKAIILLQDDPPAFLIQDINAKRNCLQNHKFQIICQKIIKFSNGRQCLNFCTCDKPRRDFINQLKDQTNAKAEEMQNELDNAYPPCLHLRVALELISYWFSEIAIDFEGLEEGQIEDHGYSKVTPLVKEVAFSHEKLICVHISDFDFGVLSVDREGFVCFTCSYGRHSCEHVKTLSDYVKGCEATLPDFLVDLISCQKQLKERFKRVFKKRAISCCAISFNISLSQRKIYDFPSLHSKSPLNLYELNVVGREMCPTCTTERQIRWMSEGKRLFTLFKVFEVAVSYRYCEQCEVSYNYCGTAEGILNMGDFLVGHDVLRDYMHHFLSSESCSLIHYFECWKANLMDAGTSEDNLLNYQQWRMTWYSFVDLLDIDYEYGFRCSICSKYPKVLSCDATSLGFRNSLRATNVSSNSEQISRGTNLTGSSFDARVLVLGNDLRKLMREYTAENEFSPEKRRKLFTKLKERCKTVHDFLICLESCFGQRECLPRSSIDFINCLSSMSSVTSYFPCNRYFYNLMEDIFNGMVISDKPDRMMQLSRVAPVIYRFIAALPSEALPDSCINLLRHLQDMSKKIFDTPAHDLPSPVEDNSQGSFFPCWAILAARGTYAKDREKKQKDSFCVKRHRRHPALTPGLFTLYCQHDICYGFQVMESQESPNVPFTILRQRFAQAPSAVIYDNACNLQEYCLNRDPGFFKMCEFLVDRFHWRNHTGCAPSCNISVYSRYEEVNSQINEQRNSLLKRLRNQLSYMSETNFVNHLKLYLWNRNRLVFQRKRM